MLHRLARRVPLLTKSRLFSTATGVARADIIQNLYLNELRSFQKPKEVQKVDLPETFTHPAAPPKPAIDTGAHLATESAADAMAEEQWPALYNPIDDPAVFTEEWDFFDNGDSLYPKRKVAPHYDDGHH